MNLSDDPSDRLVDSLLREQARGRADEALLQEIEAGLQISAHRRRRRSSGQSKRIFAIAAVLLLTCLMGMSWYAVRKALGKSRELEAARTSEKAEDSRDLDAERKRLETRVNASRSRGPAIPERSEALAEPAAVEIPENTFRVRCIVLKGGLPLAEVYAHDPSNREGRPGIRLEIREDLGHNILLPWAKGKVVLTTSPDPASVLDPSKRVASANLPEKSNSAVFLLLPGSGKRGDLPLRILVIDDRLDAFPGGSSLVISLSPMDVRLQLEKKTYNIHPGERVLIKDQPLNANNTTAIRAACLRKGEWQRVMSNVWPATAPNRRTLHLIYEDAVSGNLRFQAIRDVTPPALLANTEAAGSDSPDRTREETGAGKRMGEDISTLLARLDYVRSDATKWYVQFGFESEGKWAPRLVGLTPQGQRFQNHVEFAAMLNAGDLFFKEGPMAGRFKFIGMVEREVVSKRTRLTQMTRFAQYEDMRATRRGLRYESQANLHEAELGDRAYEDLTAVFHFYPADGKKSEFEVHEGTTFARPPGREDGKYFLKRVERDHVIVEFQTSSGETETRSISLK